MNNRQEPKDEKFTPLKYIISVREVFTGMSKGTIDLDPCSTWGANAIIKAAKYYDKEKNGLLFPWHGKVFLNPPYSRGNLDIWPERLKNQYENGICIEAILLVPNSTDTKWFQSLLNQERLVCLTDHRIRFLNEYRNMLTNSEFGNAFVYFGKNEEAFIKEFSKHGTIVRTIKGK